MEYLGEIKHKSWQINPRVVGRMSVSGQTPKTDLSMWLASTGQSLEYDGTTDDQQGVWSEDSDS